MVDIAINGGTNDPAAVLPLILDTDLTTHDLTLHIAGGGASATFTTPDALAVELVGDHTMVTWLRTVRQSQMFGARARYELRAKLGDTESKVAAGTMTFAQFGEVVGITAGAVNVPGIQGPRGLTGATGVLPSGDWSAGSYDTTQMVSHEGSSWLSLVDDNEQEPGAGEQWQLLFDGNAATDVLRAELASTASPSYGSGGVGFKLGDTGAVARTVFDKLREIISDKDMGAVSDGVTSDTVAVQKIKDAADARDKSIIFMGSGRQKTTGSFWPNGIGPTLIRSDKPSVVGFLDGTPENPNDVDDDPVVYVHKHSRYDNGTDSYAHWVGGGYFGHSGYGSGDADNPTNGTIIALLGNAVLEGTNVGTDEDPAYDLQGNGIGVAGFVTSKVPWGIVAGGWLYATGPELNADQHTALPNTNWSIVGGEINFFPRHPDIGYRDSLSGKGCVAGLLINNYREDGSDPYDAQFGLIIRPTPIDGNFSNHDIDNYNGYHVGIHMDGIKKYGIAFGQHWDNDTYGIHFPDTYLGTTGPKAAIGLGNTQMNMGNYTGAAFNDRDFWNNAGDLYFRNGSTSERLLKHSGTTVKTNASALAFVPNGGATQFNIGYVTSAVNYLGVFAAATGNTVALVAQGSDTNRSIELRTAGTGRVWIGPYTSSSDAAVTGYIEVKDSSGVTRKVATIT